MAKRCCSILLCLLLVMVQAVPAACTGMDYKTVYETAIQDASNDISNLQALADSISMLEQVGVYAYARLYVMYFQALLEIQQSEDFDTASLRLGNCSRQANFVADVQERGLPSCDELLVYIDARKLESSGRIDDAYSVFVNLPVLDAPDRAFQLALMIANATPTPTPVPTPTPTPTPKPTSTPTPTPTPKPTSTPTPKPTATPTPTPAPTSTPRPISDRDEFTRTGNYVFFGTYPQTKAGTDQTPIEWLVLDYDSKNNKALLLSRYGLDVQPYNEKYTDTTWEKCTLRAWLNSTFLNKAFTAQEQAGILLTDVDNGKSQGYSYWSTDGGNNTPDKVFLLSYAEANKYLGVTWYADRNNTKSRVAPTAYAATRGVYANSREKTAEGAEARWWWLRSPGYSQSNAADVRTDGSLYYDNVYYDNGCVRPALWINLESDIPALEPTPTSIYSAARDAKFSVGNYVTFGHYPQTSEGNDSTPIEWIVLDRDGNEALLLSRYGLDVQPYNGRYNNSWEDCTLRAWLNGAFLNKAFSAQEQAGVLLRNVDNSRSKGFSGWNTSGGNNTQDKIFLLSYAEANKYLGVTYENSNNTKSRVAPTAYALKQGAYTYSSNKTADGTGAGWWWLRSPGFYQNCAADVRADGSLSYNYVGSVSAVVRPALWINLESDIF